MSWRLRARLAMKHLGRRWRRWKYFAGVEWRAWKRLWSER